MASNCVLVTGLKTESVERSIACPGFALSSITVALFADLALTPSPVLSRRSCACLRSASCSDLRKRALRVASSSSSSEDSSSSSAALRRLLASRCSSTRCALLFLFAAASASAFAFAAAAFLAFSRSTSESSAASQESRTYMYTIRPILTGTQLCGIDQCSPHRSPLHRQISFGRRL